MSVALGIRAAVRAYEIETGHKLRGIVLSREDFALLLPDLSAHALVPVYGEDPWCGLSLAGISVEWADRRSTKSPAGKEGDRGER